MIRTIKVDLNAAYPNMPLEPVNVFAGSAASFTICNVPRAVGDRAITLVALEFKTRGGVSETLPAVRVGSAWEVTIPASRFPLPYSAALGVRIVGIGKDENKSGATWVLGVADLNVLNNQGQVTPGADAGDVKHSEFADLDPDNTPLAVVIERLKGSAMSLALVLTSLLVSFTAVAALPVTPVYTNNNRFAGMVMTNMQQWASAVEEAIGQGGGGTMSGETATNISQNVIRRSIETNLLCTIEMAQEMTNDDSIVRGFLIGDYWYGFKVRDSQNAEYLGQGNVEYEDGWLKVNGVTVPHPWDFANYYTKSEIDGTSVTNGGAKSYADATFRTNTDNVCHADSFGRWITGPIPTGVTLIGDQPIFNGYWRWDYEEGSYFASQNSDQNATNIVFWNDDGAQYWFHAYRIKSSTSGQPFVTADNVPSTNGFVTAQTATNASEAVVSPVRNRVDYLEGYIAGQRVRVSVTNYYGNTSGQLPRLRIEEFITATNVVGGVSTETNYWQIVWDEQNKYDLFLQEARTSIAAMTNNLYQTYYQILQERLATKAPRAWGTLTSAGESAPAGSVWHTEPNTVFAGGTEYAHAMVGTGVIGVLKSKGSAVYTDGETGRFHFTTDDKTAYFGMNIATRYELGCATDGITVTPVGGNQMVELLYNVTMTGKPILYYTPTLSGNITWEQITDSSGAAIPGATVTASWDQSPPVGSEICDINCGQGVSGYFKASIEYSGTSKFETNMMADLAGGILATNQTNNQIQPVEPYISNGSVLWRIKQ